MNRTTQTLDESSKKTAEALAVKIGSEVPSDKQNIFLAISNAYLDGFVNGQNLKAGEKNG
jgi:hypothetical protein